VVFGIDFRGQTSEVGRMLRLAIVSCRTNTNHEISVLADMFSSEFSEWLDSLGVQRIEVETPLANSIRDANLRTGYPLQAIGNYLRYEACRVIDEEVFLYCDCDTIFLRAFDAPETPKLLSAVAEDNLDDWSKVNSGVLAINRKALLNELDGFYSFARGKLEHFYPGFDQAALNAYFAGRIERLPAEFNWRPYWGANSDAIILHTHGVKTRVAEQMFEGLFVADRKKQMQIEALVLGTLNHLPSFAPSLIPFKGEEIASRWLSLSQCVEDVQRTPLRVLLSKVASVRQAREEAWHQSERANLRLAFAREGQIKLNFSLPPSATTLRIVINSSSLLVGLTNVRDSYGNILDINTSLKGNVASFEEITHGAMSYWIVGKNDHHRHLDLIFTISAEHESGRIFTCELSAVALARVRYYWSQDGRFDEKMAENAYGYID
jgi:hypothetical protein